MVVLLSKTSNVRQSEKSMELDLIFLTVRLKPYILHAVVVEHDRRRRKKSTEKEKRRSTLPCKLQHTSSQQMLTIHLSACII